MLKGRFVQPNLYVCLALVVALAGVSLVLGTMTPVKAGGFGLIVVLTVSQIMLVRHWRRESPGNG